VTAPTQTPAPAEVEGFWLWDNVHAPRPIAPISGDTITQHLAAGFTRAMAELGSRAVMRSRQFNNYPYHSILQPPQVSGDDSSSYVANLAKFVPRIGELWQNEWLQSILPGLNEARSLDYASLDDARLIEAFRKQLDDSAYRWWIHGKLNFVLVPASEFVAFYNEQFHPESPVEAYEVLQGFETLSLQQGRGLWHLSRIVKADAGLQALFEQTETHQLLKELSSTVAAASFVSQFNTYLDEFGWRSDAIFDIAATPWIEDPSIPLNIIRGYVSLDEAQSPDAELSASIARREYVLDQARTKLASTASAATFEQLYEAARHNLTVTEDHNYYIDCLGVAVLRLPLLEIGRRLADSGQLAIADDVFMLRLAELEPALLSRMAVAHEVRQRRGEMEAAAAQSPPPFFGTPEPIDASDPFLVAMLSGMMGLDRPMQPPDDPRLLKGVPASGGMVRGRAKVVRSLADASKLQPGDVMVCEMTTPPWAPLFSTIAGIVADTGGVLSHCAIVAREFRLPAVVGTIYGTRILCDEMLITVDGTQGVVRVESDHRQEERRAR
jgi:rifampicin phosphotransferase